jgi:hypothetical protein
VGVYEESHVAAVDVSIAAENVFGYRGGTDVAFPPRNSWCQGSQVVTPCNSTQFWAVLTVIDILQTATESRRFLTSESPSMLCEYELYWLP